MERSKSVYYDLPTVALLRASLDQAWASLPPHRQARISKTVLAAGLLKSAAEGERDPDRLCSAALTAIAA